MDVTIIDNDVEMIQSAARFGFKIYYGDGTRLDVLHASGAATARAIAVCVDKAEAADRIVELVSHEFPQAKLMVRSFDREHSLRLIHAGVDFQIRETFESAVLFGQAALVELGADEDDAIEIAEQIRRRDAERFELEIAGGGLNAGAKMVFGNSGQGVPTPTPFTAPKRASKTLNPQDVPEGRMRCRAPRSPGMARRYRGAHGWGSAGPCPASAACPDWRWARGLNRGQ